MLKVLIAYKVQANIFSLFILDARSSINAVGDKTVGSSALSKQRTIMDKLVLLKSNEMLSLGVVGIR